MALLLDDEAVLGMIDLSAIDDRIFGVRPGGLFRGAERLAVSRVANLEDAFVCHGDLNPWGAAATRVPDVKAIGSCF